MTPLQHQVVVELRSRCDALGRSIATYVEMAESLGITPDQVRAAIEQLHQAGFFSPYEPSMAGAQFFGRLPAA